MATNVSTQPNLRTRYVLPFHTMQYASDPCSTESQPANLERQTVQAKDDSKSGNRNSKPSSKKRKRDNKPASPSNSTKLGNGNRLTDRSYIYQDTREKVKKVISHVQELRDTVEAQRQEIATLRQERQDLMSQIERQQE